MSALAELRAIPQWVCWRYEDRGGPKPTKPPVSPRTGHKISAHIPSNWASYEEACAFAEDNNLPGVGYVLTPDDGFTGIDLDDCRDPTTGALDEGAAEIVALGETYAEVSPSGTGLRLIARGKVEKATINKPAGVEIYGDRRYLTITGERLPEAPDEIREAPRTLESLLARVAAFASPLASAEPPKPLRSVPATRQAATEARGKDRFRRVNDAALANLAAWVPELFPGAKPASNGGYRIASRNLGRALQEDLSITPIGIKDFGVHDMGDAHGGKRTAIDIVMEWGGAPNAAEAAEWLAERLGVPFERSTEIPQVVLGDVDEPPSPASGAPSRELLILAEWLKRELPERDYLLGRVLCTTSRWIVYGETGVGKTLFAAELAGAVASGKPMLNWEGRRPSRVMYLDGELPAETFKERMELIAERYGENLDFYGYCRDVLTQSDMPALNTPRGEAWLLREIETIQPDLIVFDSIMCLLAGSMAEEESWEPIKSLIRTLTTKRIAQIWLHHTGHDTSRGFGTKTREWEMDTVISLTKSKDGGDNIALEFTKARLRTPSTADEFQSRLIRRGASGWTDEAQSAAGNGRRASGVENLKNQIFRTYDQLAELVGESFDGEGRSIRLVSWTAIAEGIKARGHLEVTDGGAMTGKARTQLHRAKTDLINAEFLVQNDNLVWRPDFPV
jgi:hypothetical protein